MQSQNLKNKKKIEEEDIFLVVTTYLASHVDKVTIDCFFKLYMNVMSPI